MYRARDNRLHRDVALKILPEPLATDPDRIARFGLAKLTQPGGSGALAALTASPTITTPAMTGVGVILGTAAYMAPEQARGKPVDKRADVWAFGCVLYEMLTGTRAFDGDDVTVVTASIIKSEPDWAALPADVPPAIRTILRGCLQKDARRRIRDIGDVRLALEGGFSVKEIAPLTAAAVPPARGRIHRAVPWASALVAGCAVALGAAWMLVGGGPAPLLAPKRFVLTLPQSDELPPASGTLIGVSPDGQTLIYRARRDGAFTLYKRSLNQFDVTPIGEPHALGYVFFSPDSQWLGYTVGTTLKKIPLAGGPSQTICELPQNPQSRAQCRVGRRRHHRDSISPDGTRVALDVRDQEDDIWTWDFARGTLTRLTFSAGPDEYPVWTPDGRRIICSSARDKNNAPYSQAADGTGAAERLTSDQRQLYQAAVAPDGTRVVLTAATTSQDGGGEDLVLLPLDGDRRIAPLLQTPYLERNPTVSPDGRWLAYQSNESGGFEIYVRPFPQVDGGRWQISVGGGTQPAWSPDGRELFYLGFDQQTLMRVPVEPGAVFQPGPPERLLDLSAEYSLSAVGRNYGVSRDGRRFLMIKAQASANRADINVVVSWFEELKRLVPVN